jgi:hypothetical protein
MGGVECQGDHLHSAAGTVQGAESGGALMEATLDPHALGALVRFHPPSACGSLNSCASNPSKATNTSKTRSLSWLAGARQWIGRVCVLVPRAAVTCCRR